VAVEWYKKCITSASSTVLLGPTREYKSGEVAQSQIYVIVHSLLEVSFCTQPFPTHSGWLWSLWFLTLVIYM